MDNISLEPSLLDDDKTKILELKKEYLSTQLITYLGNKRKLLNFIEQEILKIKKLLNKDKLITADLFAGSGAVSRMLKEHSSILVSNDFEKYSSIVNECYLAEISQTKQNKIYKTIDKLNNYLEHNLDETGYIYKHYAPKDEKNIKAHERVFYTPDNAKRLDTAKKWIFTNITKKDIHYYLAPLIVQASINVNTSGVFKGFHKKNGIGSFGGGGGDAISRITKKIVVPYPIFFNTKCEVKVFNEDTNELIKNKELPKFDIAYFDIPYNQHPYGSNYFMLNILANKNDPNEEPKGVSGIISNWKRSPYYKRRQAEEALDNLIKNTNSKYIVLSYNDEGLIPVESVKKILEKYGELSISTKEYNAYRGSKSFDNRRIRVYEYLWILRKQ